MSVATRTGRGSLAESQQRSGALGLALVAVDRRGVDAGGVQVAHHAVGTVLGAGEHQRAVDLLAFVRPGRCAG